MNLITSYHSLTTYTLSGQLQWHIRRPHPHKENEFQPPTELIEALITWIALEEVKCAAAITLSPSDLLYLFEFGRISEVGGIASPYATIEWLGVHNPRALTPILQDNGINIALITIEDDYQEASIFFFKRNSSRGGLNFDVFLDQKADFLRYAV